jgi:transposase-like protein
LAKTRKTYPEALKAKIALEAIKGERTMAELSSIHDVHPVMIANWKKHLMVNAAELFVRGTKKKPRT